MSTEVVRKTCIVVGAGMSGLLGARTLERAGIRTIVFEKERSIGGRMATRRVEDGVFDYGAQFFTVRDDRFARLVAEWQEEGVVAEWSRGFAGPDGSNNQDGHPRYRGATGMAAIPAHLARGLEVRTGERIVALRHEDRRWQVGIGDGTTISADALLLTAPAEQSLALIDGVGCAVGRGIREALETIEYARCISVMAVLDGPSGVPEPGGVQYSGQNGDGDPIWWLADNQRKGISPAAPAITVHAGPRFSLEYWDRPEEEVATALLGSAHMFLRSNVSDVRTHRWRYSQPVKPHPERCLVVSENPPLVVAGDAFGGAKVEGAALSGLTAAWEIRRLLS